MNRVDVAVLVYNHYMGPDSQTVYDQQYYCGSCRQRFDKPYDFPEYPDALEAQNQSWGGLGDWTLDRGDLVHFAFCPWCGVQFKDEWWMNRTIQNERPIDHFQNPGHHKGDSAVFPGRIEGHYLSTTGDTLCWCDPICVPSLMGCEILHQDKEPPARADLEALDYKDDDYDDD
jgi:hypothetical protein